MDEQDASEHDEVDRALELAFGPPTWTEGGGVLPQIEQSTGMRLRTSLLPLAGEEDLRGAAAPSRSAWAARTRSSSSWVSSRAEASESSTTVGTAT